MAKKNTYSSHKEQLEAALPPKERTATIEKCLTEAFKPHIEYRSVGFIQFDQISVTDLANAFVKYPIIVKTILACINVAGRAVARDLQITIDTYKSDISPTIAAAIAGYIKPILPRELAIPALLELDRFFWTDKEMRAFKGNWEKAVTDTINQYAAVQFKKRKFKNGKKEFEIDAAYPSKGDSVEIAIDIKRIESPRDIHKRSDEIINKAVNFKKCFPKGKFYAIIYYPFPSEMQNVITRLQSEYIDGVFSANAIGHSVKQVAKLLLGKEGKLKRIK